MTVAEIGTGTRFVAAGLAGSAHKMIGVDASGGMLGTRCCQLRQAWDRKRRATARPTSAHSRSPTTRSMPPSPTWFSTARRIRPRCSPRWRALCAPAGGRDLRRGRASQTWMREEQADVWLGFTRAWCGSRALLDSGPSELQANRRRLGGVGRMTTQTDQTSIHREVVVDADRFHLGHQSALADRERPRACERSRGPFRSRVAGPDSR